MQSNKSMFLIFLGLAVLYALNQSFYIVTEGQQVMLTKFGKPESDSITDAGMYFKLPWLKATYVDKRILSWDGSPNQIPTKDKKYIKVDTTARWQIVDALKFIQTVRNERGAQARLDTILDGATRDVISNQNLVEAVRNSNAIIEWNKKLQQEINERKEKGQSILEEEMSGEIEPILIGREQLSQKIVERAETEVEALGIKLIDVQLRRISYEASVEKKVYERMISERQRIAQKIRSIGKGEKAEIEGRLSKDLREIQSKAYRKAQTIRGKADAESFDIYAKSLNRDPKFYEFMRSMEAYKKALKPNSKLLLSSKSEFLKYLK
jgi:membrane protease subunit HflC